MLIISDTFYLYFIPIDASIDRKKKLTGGKRSTTDVQSTKVLSAITIRFKGI